MTISIWHKLLSAFLYMIPWNEAIHFGNELFYQYPFLQFLLIPVLPIIIFNQIIPVGNIIIFLILFLGIIRNSNINYFLRFHTLQAILLDICIILINYIYEIGMGPFKTTMIVKTLSVTICISILSIIIFSIFKCLKGDEADIPGISNAVRIQL